MMPTKEKSQKAGAKIGGRYVEGIGRRKTAVARVRLVPGTGKLLANNKSFEGYFHLSKLDHIARSPIEALKLAGKFDVFAKVAGGGIRAQAEALRHGIARALVLYNDEFKKRLRSLGYLTRDSRMVERKKYGLKKARRAPQWQKR